MRELLLHHLADHYQFYGESVGVKTARKHIGWYVNGLPNGVALAAHINRLDTTTEQFAAVDLWFLAQAAAGADSLAATCDNHGLSSPYLHAA
jgi:tRNA-dihydrouridine synthase B